MRLALLAAAWGAAAAAQAGAVDVNVVDAAGKPLPDAVVFLESPAAKAAAKPMSGVEIAQVGKTFLPMVSVVTVGTAVSFPNRDTVRHHVYSFSPIKRFEIKLYVGTPASPVVFDQPGIALLGCNIHDNMIAWVLAVETPWHGRTDAQGRLRWASVPPGSYQLRTWHPDFGVGAPAQSRAVNVGDAPVAADVRLAAAAK